MLLATGAVSVGSFVFWLIAARTADTELIGAATELFTAIFFISYATSLGLPPAVARFAAGPDRRETRRFGIALVATTVASAVGSTLFFLVDPAGILDPLTSGGVFGGWAAFTILSAGLAVSVLVDVRLMGHRRWQSVFVRSAAIGIIRLPPLVWALSLDSAAAVFWIAAGGYAVTALPYLPGLMRGAEHGPLRWIDHERAVRFAGVNYAAELAVQAPFWVTPLIVALEIDSDSYATFYLSWGIMSVVYMSIHLLGRTLLVEGRRSGADPVRQARTTMAIALTISIAATAGSLITGPLIALMYGSDHDRIATLLPLLMAGTIPWAITRTSLALARVQASTTQTLLLATATATTVVVGAALGGWLHDATGAAVGWIIGSCAALIVSVPTLRSQLRQLSGIAVGP
jgi:O-antigen/teichoic acid export membrane protein